MKKIISLILCTVMLFGFVQIAAFAEEPVAEAIVLETETVTDSNRFLSGAVYEIKPGCTVTIENNVTVYIPSDCTLTVCEGAKLIIYGNIIVLDNGSLIVDGELANASKVQLNSGKATAKVKITYPKLIDCGTDPVKFDSIKCWYGDNVTADIAVSEDPETPKLMSIPELETSGNCLDLENGGSFYCNLNKVLFVQANIKEPNPQKPRYDGSKYQLYYKGVGLVYKQGYYTCVMSNSGELSFSQWKNDTDYYRNCKVVLPTGEGYEVVGRDNEIGADSAVILRYGEPFAFRVEVDEAYDMSYYEVYIFNGYGYLNLNLNDPEVKTSFASFAATPDADGYYTIPAVEGDTTVYIVGVIKNETITMIGSILEALKNMFNMIKEFFQGILELFKPAE